MSARRFRANAEWAARQDFSHARILAEPGWPAPEKKEKACPNCGASMELVKASDGAMIGTPYFPTHPIRGAELPRRVRSASFWACACDHCEEA